MFDPDLRALPFRGKGTAMPSDQAQKLDSEIRLFERRKAEFLQNHAGEYILVVGSDVLGFFPTDLAAYEEGLRQRGNVPMLIRCVEQAQRPASIPAMTLGLLHAD